MSLFNLKIAMVTSTYPRYQGDGVGSFIHSLACSLSRLGHEVQVFAPFDPAVDPTWWPGVSVQRIKYIWPDTWSVLGHARSLKNDMSLKWHALPLVILFSLLTIRRLYSQIIQSNFDVVYASWLVPSGFIGGVVRHLTGVPMVIHLHGSDVFVVERYKILHPFARFVLSTANHVIACSTDLATRVIRFGLSAERITVIPYGVDAERYMLADQVLNPFAQLFKDKSWKVVMGMGRLVPKKGFAYLLRAAPIILSRFPNTLFVIVGEGDSRSQLEALVKEEGIQKNVLFVGRIPWDQTPAYLKMADVFVVPSIRDEAGNVDGLPNVLLEAMAAGCAIVASRIGGIPDVIHDGENGLLVPPKDEVALAEAICSLLSNERLRRRLGEAAQKTTITQYKWMQIAERIEAVLKASVGRL
jgi:glycosyltransferase involved in cell wall biosynthesis